MGFRFRCKGVVRNKVSHEAYWTDFLLADMSVVSRHGNSFVQHLFFCWAEFFDGRCVSFVP